METHKQLDHRVEDDPEVPGALEGGFEDRVMYMLQSLQSCMANVQDRVATLEVNSNKPVEEQQSCSDEDDEPDEEEEAEPHGSKAAEPHGSNAAKNSTPSVDRSAASAPKVQHPPPAPVRKSTPKVRDPTAPKEPTTMAWADRSVNEEVDFSLEVNFDDEFEEETEAKGTKLFKATEKTEKFLACYFTTAVPNQTRRQWKDKFGAPSTPYTACPNLDKVIKSRLLPVTKSRDKQLARQQALTLDAVGPLTYILEEAAKGELSQKSAVEAAQTALKLLGNASAYANRERRKNALQNLNSRIVDMADDDSNYTHSAPLLFGEGFCKKAKERDEELKCLNQVSTNRKPKDSNFFRGGRPYRGSPGGTGHYSRGRTQRGFQRNHPYQGSWHQNQHRKSDSKKN